MKKILVLPGTEWQIPLIRKIKELGHKVHVVNPVKNAEVIELADYFFESDIFEIDKIEQYAKENNIDAVISDECDIAMPVVAELGKRLNVNTLSTEVAALFTDKFLMREHCKKIGLKGISYKLCREVEEAIQFQKEINGPIIMKPLDSNASHGVFKANSEEDIKANFNETLSFSRRDSVVLVERYIEGTEFTVDGIKTPNGHYTLAISEKKHFIHNENIANELYFSHYNQRFDYEKLKYINDYFVNNSPLEMGLTHAEYKYENGQFYLIEIGARGGGNMISSIITEYMSGYDSYEYLINYSLGYLDNDKEFRISHDKRYRTSVLKFFETPSDGGIVKGVDGEDYLKKESAIKAYRFNFNIGDYIENAKNDSVRIGFYIACEDNEQKLKVIMDEVDKRVKIKVLQ
ncbi:ATP-grasp domain-containing protein [Pseudobutyrivibrio ruminis]|uniref:ATP-grasp domain-containing protein n=1 Tax=Pseudobutyrivibrio ruminis TaxID=46206 RepID=A0A1H7KAL6_9FIRM|nr:ATP-grasp domain-containing protein [Pseudobutyrivibrio ruminis]SEK82965.1 ATP-grasp domain-containing protein [Pseudobutyrivibrio ruminis]